MVAITFNLMAKAPGCSCNTKNLGMFECMFESESDLSGQESMTSSFSDPINSSSSDLSSDLDEY